MTPYELFQVMLLFTIMVFAVVILLTGFIWALLKMSAIAIDIIADAWAEVCVAWRNRK